MSDGVGTVQTSGLYPLVREDWLALHGETPLEPDLPIVDAHHHLWDRSEEHYLIDAFSRDVNSGHNIEASVYVDCRSMYRADGPEEFRSVGEVEFANGMAAMAASGTYGPTRMCAAIVGHADLRLGEAVRPVLEALALAGGGRFRGTRQVSAWDADERVSRRFPSRPAGLLLDGSFREGFAVLGSLGLSFDAFLFHPQLPELADLAKVFPDVPIVLDHAGGPLGIASYASARAEAFDAWRKDMKALARCENVSVKLSGLGMRMPGFDFHERPVPPSSSALAEAWSTYFDVCVETFGVGRCMFASNFPPDKGTCSYVVLWNAFKRIAAQASADEKEALFRGTARKFYRIQ